MNREEEEEEEEEEEMVLTCGQGLVGNLEEGGGAFESLDVRNLGALVA